jgi:hypothetical protein
VHLLDRDTVITVGGNSNNLVEELSGIGPGHTDILSAHPSRVSQLR